jgi:hypothetical protein
MMGQLMRALLLTVAVMWILTRLAGCDLLRHRWG